jgi:hypothetical protein
MNLEGITLTDGCRLEKSEDRPRLELVITTLENAA